MNDEEKCGMVTALCFLSLAGGLLVGFAIPAIQTFYYYTHLTTGVCSFDSSQTVWAPTTQIQGTNWYETSADTFVWPNQTAFRQGNLTASKPVKVVYPPDPAWLNRAFESDVDEWKDSLSCKNFAGKAIECFLQEPFESNVTVHRAYLKNPIHLGGWGAALAFGSLFLLILLCLCGGMLLWMAKQLWQQASRPDPAVVLHPAPPV